jgi:hypothetical protein
MIRVETINHTFVEHRLASRELALLTRLVTALEKVIPSGDEVPVALSDVIKEAADAAEALRKAQETQGA